MAELLYEVRLRQESTSEIEETSKARLQGRGVSQAQGGYRPGAEERIVCQKCAVYLLRSTLSEIEYGTDVAKNRKRCGTEKRNSVLQVGQKLGVAPNELEIM